jgi:hypothetical protein
VLPALADNDTVIMTLQQLEERERKRERERQQRERKNVYNAAAAAAAACRPSWMQQLMMLLFIASRGRKEWRNFF